MGNDYNIENEEEYFKRPNVKVTGLLISEASNRVYVAYVYGFKDIRVESECVACTYNFVINNQGNRSICYDNERELWKALRKNFWGTEKDLPSEVKEKWESRIRNKIIDQTVKILYAKGGRVDDLEYVIWE